MKLRKLHIEEYKMFKDFDISFVDKNDEALPIVVLAGVNGCGKTTLLECLANKSINNQHFEVYKNKDFIVNLISVKTRKKERENTNLIIDPAIFIDTPRELANTLVYFPVSVNQLQDIEIKIVEEYIKTAEEIDSLKKALKVLQEKIDNIFIELNIDFRVSHVDYNKKKVFLSDINSDTQYSMDTLSTGEKTLLSKVLSLYFSRYENKIILIDEPELSLHPSWQNKVLKLYENFALKNNCQIIIATHSPHIIGSAKPEYIRLLVKEGNQIKVVDNIDKSYGLQFDKILTDIMGVENLRTPAVAKDIKRLWELLEDEAYESKEYMKLYNALENILGSLDEDMILARLEIAKIKSQNAQSK